MTSPSPIGFDCETHVFVRGRMIPRMVCLTLAGLGDVPTWLRFDGDLEVETRAGRWSAVLGRSAAVAALPDLLEYPGLLVAHNAAFDLAVLCELWRTWPGQTAPDWAIGRIFDRLAKGSVSDTSIREKLIRLALGEFEYIEGENGPIRVNYGLGWLASYYFGKGAIDSAKKTKTATLAPGEEPPEEVMSRNPMAPWRLRYWQLDGTPVRDWPEDAKAYALGDAEWAIDIRAAQVEVHPHKVDVFPLFDGDRVVSEDRETRADFALRLMGAWGMRCDPVAVEKTVATWHAAAEKGREVAAKMGWIRDEEGRIPGDYTKRFEKYLAKGGDPAAFTGKRWKKSGKPYSQVKKHLQSAVVAACVAGGLEVPMTAPSDTFPKGQIQYGEDVLRAAGTAMATAAGMDPEEHPLVQYADTRTYAGFDTKYSHILRMGAQWPVTSDPSHLVETGRTGWRNPPMQQPPKKGGFRDAFVPRPGHLFVSVDYDTIELVALAQVCLWLGFGSRLAEVIQRGEDVHAHTAVALLNLEGVANPLNHDGDESAVWTYDLFRECRSGDRGVQWADLAETYRDTAKIANFGFPGGQGAVTMAANSNLTLAQAASLKLAWETTYPELSLYLSMVSDACHLGSFTAQQAVSLRLRGGVGYTDGANTFFQGLVADGGKAAAFLVARECYAGDGPLAGCRPVLFLHDEIIMETPEDRAHDAAYRLRDLMVDTMQEHTPDVPVTAEPALMRRWYKRAKTVIEDGRLRPWDP